MDSLDTELLGLISRLNKIQKEVGGGEKKVIHQLSGGKVDRFLDLCDSMNERLETIKNAIDEIKKLEKTPGANPTELISNQSKVRSELNQLNDEWKELDMLYRIESKKKRSRHTPEELTARKDMVLQLQNAINNIKDMQRSGFVKEYQGARMATMEESEMFQKKDLQTGAMRPDGTAVTTPARGIGQRNNYMTEDHKQRLMLIKERDQRIDEEIEDIGKGVDMLRELALQANEEVKIQNKMLDTLEEKVLFAGDHVLNINERMKVTLEQARKSDKICMDIVCVMILVGMIIVLYKLNSANQGK